MTKEETLKLLADLGTTAEQIAASLKEMGVTGDHRSGSCPVANFLNRQGDDKTYSVGMAVIYPGAEVYISSPEPIRQFVWEFDGGKYPDLENT